MTNETALAPADLGWLLEDFAARVPGVDSALLASSDGLKLTRARLSADEADRTAALMSGFHSLAKSTATITAAVGGGLRQIVVELDRGYLFVMSAGAGLPANAPVHVGTATETVGTVLAVLAEQGADVGVIGYEMGVLARSVGEHLVVPVRPAEAPHGEER